MAQIQNSYNQGKILINKKLNQKNLQTQRYMKEIIVQLLAPGNSLERGTT